jgi:hypothetical protein
MHYHTWLLNSLEGDWAMIYAALPFDFDMGFLSHQ